MLGASKSWIDLSLDKQATELLNAMPVAWQASYQSVLLSWIGAIKVEKIAFKPVDSLEVMIKTITLPQAWQLSHPTLYPDSAQLLLNDIQINNSDLDQLRLSLLQLMGYQAYHLDKAVLASLGYNTIAGQAQLQIQTVAPASLQLNIEWLDSDIGTWRVQLLVDMTVQQLLNKNFKWQQWDNQITWQHIAISFEPGRLWIPMLDALAQKQGVSLNLLQQQLTIKAAQDLKPWLYQQDNPTRTKKLAAFINNNEKISLSITPKPALSLEKLYQLPLSQWHNRLQMRLL